MVKLNLENWVIHHGLGMEELNGNEELTQEMNEKTLNSLHNTKLEIESCLNSPNIVRRR